MEEVLVAVFILLVNIMMVVRFAPYLEAALSKLPEYATPIRFAAAFGKGMLNQLMGIPIK